MYYAIDVSVSSLHRESTDSLIYIGESGLVYRGYLKSGAGHDLVAVKTIKGNLSFCYSLKIVYLCPTNGSLVII